MANLILPLYLVVLVLSGQQAHAYLDPGNGSMLLQIILGGAAGLGVLLKYYWHQVIGFFKFKKNSQSKDI